MGNIYWLASYPKSGNTWMRLLLTNYLRNAGEAADINSLDGGPIASAASNARFIWARLSRHARKWRRMPGCVAGRCMSPEAGVIRISEP